MSIFQFPEDNANQNKEKNVPGDVYISLFFSTLNEKQRRWFAGLESLKLDYSGDKIMSNITGLDVNTIANGRHLRLWW